MLVSVIVVLSFFVGNATSLVETVPTPQGELRVVDKDPRNWTSIAYNVFEHLIELDPEGRLVPRLATSWRWLDDRTLEVALRQG
jgi:peptide/nickel transport system substrate-binding protein